MTCKEVLALTADDVAGANPADIRSALDAHRGACADCAAYLASYLATVALAKSAYRGADEAPLPASVIEAVLTARKKKS